MIDKFLSTGSSFDWITPLWAFVQDAYYGSPAQINLPQKPGRSAAKIADRLRSKGVRCWGVMVVGDTITFTVRKPQERYTVYWLCRWGVL